MKKKEHWNISKHAPEIILDNDEATSLFIIKKK